jgi:hypothetical protein
MKLLKLRTLLAIENSGRVAASEALSLAMRRSGD